MNTTFDEPIDMPLALALVAVGIYATHAKVFNKEITEEDARQQLPQELDELVFSCLQLLHQITATSQPSIN